MVTKKMIVNYSLVILWMVLIFVFSAQHADQTKNLSMSVARIAAGGRMAAESGVLNDSSQVIQLNLTLRSFAHYFLYLVLGILSIRAVRKAGKFQGVVIRKSMLICLAYAVFDEIHQFFVPGRDCDIKDVLIDLAGAVTGISVFILVCRFSSKRKQVS